MNGLSIHDSASSSGDKSGAKNTCRYGRTCRRADCYFNHPDGKDADHKDGADQLGQPLDHIDPNDINSDDDLINDLLREGATGVQLDESEQDEWFAASRACKCCEGYVYKCKKQDEDCAAAGACFCSIVRKQSQPAA